MALSVCHKDNGVYWQWISSRVALSIMLTAYLDNHSVCWQFPWLHHKEKTLKVMLTNTQMECSFQLKFKAKVLLAPNNFKVRELVIGV